jgi:Transglycosylase
MAESKHVAVTLLKNLAGVAGLAVGALALFVLFYEMHDFRPYAPRIQQIYSNMDPLNRVPPESVQNFIWKVDGEQLDSFLSRAQLGELRGGMEMVAWHYHSFMWTLMVRWHFDKKQRVAFYCHYLPYEKGTGFANAARYYFDKSADSLNIDEMATIIAIGRSPRYNSPSQHPAQFEEAKKRVLSAYAGSR